MTSRHLILISISVLTFLAWTACHHGEERVAQRKAEQIDKLQEQLQINRRILSQTDSLIAAIIPRINEVTATEFDYEKTEYDDLGHFVPKGMDPGKNVLRTYLHASVDEYGQTQLISTYCGARIDHTQLQVTASDGTSAITSEIPINDGSNYQYQIAGSHYEAVTYTLGRTTGSDQINADTDGGVLAFISEHASDSKLYGTLKGGKREVRVNISAKERKQLQAAFELGFMMRDKLRFEHENKTAALTIQFLEEKLQAKANAEFNN